MSGRRLWLAAALLACALPLAAARLARPLLTRALADRVAAELAVEVAAPELELGLATGELRLRADVSASRGGSVLRAPGTRLTFPLAALFPGRRGARPTRAEFSGAELLLSPQQLGRAAALLAPISLEDIAGSVRPAGPGAGYELDLAGRLAGGGGLSLHGRVGAGDDPLALWLELRGAELGPLRPQLRGLEELTGDASGPCRLQVPAAPGASALSCQLELNAAHLRAGELQVSGPLRLELELVGGPLEQGGSRPLSGHFQVDAGAASLALGGLTRPAGQPATILGEILPGPDGPRLEYRLHFERFQLESPRGKGG